MSVAFLQASDQKEAEDIGLQGRGRNAVCEAAAYTMVDTGRGDVGGGGLMYR